MEHDDQPAASPSAPKQHGKPEDAKSKEAAKEKGKEKAESSGTGGAAAGTAPPEMSILTRALLGPPAGTEEDDPPDLLSQLRDMVQIEKNMKELEAMESKVQEMEEIEEKMREMELIEEKMKEMEKLEERSFPQHDEEAASKRLREKEIALSFLPSFTNEENKRLNEEVIDLEKQLQALQDAVENQDDRTAIMEEHMKRVKQEIYYTECRVDARRREIATEEHIKKIAEMEAARIQREVTKFDKNSEEMVDRLRALRTAVFRANEKMDQFRLLMHWNQEELEQWSEAAKQKNDDNEAVEAYTKMDDARLKELHMDEENIAIEYTNVEKQLADEVTATQAAQIQLDKTAQDFRELHLQRQKLVRLWEDAVDAIHKRDEMIHKTAEEYADNKVRVREKKSELDVLAKDLQNEIENDVDVKTSISMAEEELGRKRELFRNEVSGIRVLEEELVLLKSNVTHATRDLSKQLSIKSHTDEELDTKKTKLETVTKQLERMRKKLEEEFALLDTLEKKMQALSKILATEEQNLKTAKEEVHDLRTKQFQLTEKLHQLRTHEKNMLFEIEGAKSQSKTLNGQIQHLEMSMMKQEEVLYAAEFQIQCLERKVARAGGERTDLEKKETSAKISELEKELDDKKAEETIILSQIKKSDEALRAAYRKKEELQKKLATSNDRNAELNLQSETGLHAVKKLIKEKEEKMLSSDLLQMEVNRLQAILDSKADEVTGMENTKKRLQLNFEEQKREIESRRDRHRSELKALQEDLHHLLIKRTKLAQHVQTLQSKYEVLIKRVQIEEGGERSANYYILKLAQERETIQREGKNLQTELDKVQKDVEVLEGATHELREANNSLRTSHNTAKSLELLEEQSTLKQDLDRVQEQIRFKQKEEQSLLEEVQDAHSRFENLEKERVRVSDSVKEMMRRVEAAEKDSQDQATKHKRALVQVEKIAKEVKEKFAVDFERIESEVHLVELREAARDTLHRLKALANEDTAIAPLIYTRIIEAGLKLPSNTSSARSSRSGSSSGSLSGRSSLRGSVGSSAAGSPVFLSPPASSPRVGSSPSPTGATSSGASPSSVTPPIGSPAIASPALSRRSSRSSSVVNLEFPPVESPDKPRT